MNMPVQYTEISTVQYLWKIVIYFNPLVTNGLSHPYHLDESIFVLRGFESIFSFLFHFSMKGKIANRIAPDGTPRIAASRMGLFC